MQRIRVDIQQSTHILSFKFDKKWFFYHFFHSSTIYFYTITQLLVRFPQTRKNIVHYEQDPALGETRKLSFQFLRLMESQDEILPFLTYGSNLPGRIFPQKLITFFHSLKTQYSTIINSRGPNIFFTVLVLVFATLGNCFLNHTWPRGPLGGQGHGTLAEVYLKSI